MPTIEELTAELDGAKARIGELNRESQGHRLNATNARTETETATAALAAATKEHGEKLTAADKRAADAEVRVSETLKASALRIAAKDAGIVDLDGLKLLDTSKVTVGADGTVAIPAKFFDEAKAAKPYLFAVTGAKTGNTSNTGRTPPPATDGANVLTMTDAEYAVARAAVTARAA
jgi:hypothetical protein